ncbi:MAG: hypothetical protein ACJ8FY_16255 [Gemmataceae bacterium]
MFNDKMPPWTYDLRTEVHQSLHFNPTELHLGMVDPHRGASGEVAIETCVPQGQEGDLLTSIEPASDDLSVRYTEGGLSNVLSDGVTKRITKLRVDLAPQSKAGIGIGQVAVNYRNGASVERRLLTVAWNVRSLYRVIPPRAFYGSFDRATADLSRRITILREDGKLLTLCKASTSNKAVMAVLQRPQRDAANTLVVTVDPFAITGSIWAEVTVETDLADQPRLVIPVAVLVGDSSQ